MVQDQESYLAKRRFFDNLLTVYGRHTVLEALAVPEVGIYRLHLADSNQKAQVLDDIIKLAEEKGAEVCYHSKKQLSRISKNARQDQGVAADLNYQGYRAFEAFVETIPQSFRLLAVDRVMNPQNLGMIVRSVAASPMTALLLPRTGGAQIDPLVIKASAGALFRAQILMCQDLDSALDTLQRAGTLVYGLAAEGDQSFTELVSAKREVFVLGSESEGLSRSLKSQCDQLVTIPMARGVESLNVSAAATLVAFSGLFRTPV